MIGDRAMLKMAAGMSRSDMDHAALCPSNSRDFLTKLFCRAVKLTRQSLLRKCGVYL